MAVSKTSLLWIFSFLFLFLFPLSSFLYTHPCRVLFVGWLLLETDDVILMWPCNILCNNWFTGTCWSSLHQKKMPINSWWNKIKLHPIFFSFVYPVLLEYNTNTKWCFWTLLHHWGTILLKIVLLHYLNDQLNLLCAFQQIFRTFWNIWKVLENIETPSLRSCVHQNILTSLLKTSSAYLESVFFRWDILVAILRNTNITSRA